MNTTRVEVAERVRSEFKVITGSVPEHTVEDELAFTRKMIKWYIYFTEGTAKSKLIKIAEELDLPRETLYRFFLLNGKLHSFREPVQSYFLKWYERERFQSREKVSAFLDEMEGYAQEFPIFDRVPREIIDELVREITEVSNISPGSLWPLGYSRKDPASRKTFPFSDYQRLIRIRDGVRLGLINDLYQLLQRMNYRLTPTILERYRKCESLDPIVISGKHPELYFFSKNGQSYAEWLYPILSRQNLSFKEYVARRGSLSDIREWEEYLLALEGWKINRVPEMRLIELRRK